MAARYLQAFYDIDVCADAGRIQCSTLVMHSEGDRTILASEGEFLASLIPHAKWVPVPGRNHVPLDTSPAWHAINAAVAQFLETVDVTQGQAASPTLTPANVGCWAWSRQGWPATSALSAQPAPPAPYAPLNP